MKARPGHTKRRPYGQGDGGLAAIAQRDPLTRFSNPNAPLLPHPEETPDQVRARIERDLRRMARRVG